MADYSRFETLDITLEGRLLTVTLNRPEKLNAIHPQMHTDIENLWPEIGGDGDVGAVLLTGAGRAFCAGGDISGMTGEGGPLPRRYSPILGPKRLLTNMLDVEQPIIAAVHGPAMGLGATIALFCDIVIMGEEAFIADTHVNVGLVAGDGGAVIWPLLMPINRAKYYLMTGERLHGPEAHRLGLVNEVVPQDQVQARAREVAERLANGPTWAIRFTKWTVNKVIRDYLNLMMDTGMALESWTSDSEDQREAAAAFFEKRQPNFTGR